MKRWFRAGFCFWFALICCSQAAVEVASGRYRVAFEDRQLLVPYESSHNPFAKNASIGRVLFVIHSGSFSAKQYYTNATAMLDAVPQQKSRTMIIAPHFLKAEHAQELSKKDFLHWQVSPFWGSSKGFYQGQEVRISAYDVVDRMLSDLVEAENFPNLREIVIIGHSAGGQMVNRYAAGNMFEDKVAVVHHITVKYVVMAPSSYVYFSNERPAAGSLTKFAVPENPPDGYNNWGYGLDNLYAYHQRHRITAEQIVNGYPGKHILYLVGSDDKDPDHDALDKSPAAMLEGPSRLVRGRLYYNYLRHLYGDTINGRQYFRIVKDVGHYGKGLMTSPECVKFVFEFKPAANP